MGHDYVIKMKIIPYFTIVRSSRTNIQDSTINLTKGLTKTKRKRKGNNYFIKSRIRVIPKWDNIARIGQRKIETSICLGIFDTKSGVVTNNTRNGAKLAASTRGVARRRHDKSG